MKKYVISLVLCLSSLNLLAAQRMGPIDSDPDDDDRRVAAAAATATAPTPRPTANGTVIAGGGSLILGTGSLTTASAAPVNYEELMKKYGYTQSLTSKPAVIGAASGLVVARLAKASMPVTVALTGAGYGIGVAHDAHSKLYSKALGWFNHTKQLADDNKTVARMEPPVLYSLDNCSYGNVPVNNTFIDKSLYAQFARNMIICCVDVFVYDAVAKKYFMVQRDQPPMKGAWWLPGGRQNFGESFGDCAKRKCKDEVGLAVAPVENLGAFSTPFDTSAHNCPTHTVNIAVLAYRDSSAPAKLDKHHAASEWRPMLNTIPDAHKNPYINEVYMRARDRLMVLDPKLKSQLQ